MQSARQYTFIKITSCGIYHICHVSGKSQTKLFQGKGNARELVKMARKYWKVVNVRKLSLQFFNKITQLIYKINQQHLQGDWNMTSWVALKLGHADVCLPARSKQDWCQTGLLTLLYKRGAVFIHKTRRIAVTKHAFGWYCIQLSLTATSMYMIFCGIPYALSPYLFKSLLVPDIRAAKNM